MFVSIRGHTLYWLGIPPAPVVLDLGANRGDFSRELAARCGGTYWLVEANRELARKLPNDESFHALYGAVATVEGTVILHVAVNDEGSSLLLLPTISEHNCVLQQEVEVPVLKLDSLLRKAGPRIDVLKMDIEGAEVPVLQAFDFVKLADVGQLSIEFHCDPTFGFGGREDVERILDKFERHGFLCLDFNAQRRIDVLALNLRQHRIPWNRRWWWTLRFRPPGWVRRIKSIIPATIKRRLR